LVGSAFRYLLIDADSRRNAFITWAHAWPWIGWLAPVALGLVGPLRHANSSQFKGRRNLAD
jgi:hypothetical protein